MINSVKKNVSLILLFLPSLTLAVDSNYVPPSTPITINDIFYSFAYGNMKGFIPVLIAIALVVFFSGVAKFIGSGDNEEKRQSGRNIMVYGIIVLFVMFAFWGLVKIITQSFFLTDPTIPNYLPFK